MKQFFPTLDALGSAPVFDVAGVVLQLLAAQPKTQYVYASNMLSLWLQEYGNTRPPEAVRALSEAFAWLENNGFLADELSQGGGPNHIFITRAGQSIKARRDFLAYAKESLLPKEILRGDLAGVVLPLFLGGHFDAAVAAAFVQVEVFVRDACGYPRDLVGVPLMRKAFNVENGPLTDLEAVPAEREAANNLFAGAMGYYKNAFSHSVVGISQAVQAASLILFANELLASAKIHANVRTNSSG